MVEIKSSRNGMRKTRSGDAMSDDLYLLSIALLTFAVMGWVMWKYPPPPPPEKKDVGFEVVKKDEP